MPHLTICLVLADAPFSILLLLVERPFPDADTLVLASAPVDMPLFQVTLVTLTAILAHPASCWWRSSACAKSQRCPMFPVTRVTHPAARFAEGVLSAACMLVTSPATRVSAQPPPKTALSPVPRPARAAVIDAASLVTDKSLAQRIYLARLLFPQVASVVI